MLSFVISSDKDAIKIVKEIEEANREQNKVYDRLIARARHINPRGDAVACGWLRQMGELGDKVSKGFRELAESLCP